MTRVLVVEDEESFSDALSYMLRKEGFEVAVCPTGPDALDTFDRSGADLVLLDLMLPGRDGIDVLRELKSSEITRAIPVMVVSGKESQEQVQQAMMAGAIDYVIKPFEPMELGARIRAFLDSLKKV